MRLCLRLGYTTGCLVHKACHNVRKWDLAAEVNHWDLAAEMNPEIESKRYRLLRLLRLLRAAKHTRSVWVEGNETTDVYA